MLTYSRAWSYACLSQTPSINGVQSSVWYHSAIQAYLIFWFIILFYLLFQNQNSVPKTEAHNSE